MSQCSQCHRSFNNEDGLRSHLNSVQNHTFCKFCNRLFASVSKWRDHCHIRNHFYCEFCKKLFKISLALKQHLDSFPDHNNRSGDSGDSEDEDSEESTSDTTSEADEGPPFCKSCKKYFIDKPSLYQHLASSKHNWCFMCSCDFPDAKALQNHLASQHAPERTSEGPHEFNCPLCSKQLSLPSAIAMHIESGACNNITRHQVTAAVHAMKIVPTISISRRLRGPSNPKETTYIATEKAWNGTAYQCYICRDTFKSLTSLNAHLNSPAHDAKEFKCPKCNRKFKLISGLIQHIESEVCEIAHFQQVENYAFELTSRFTKLLKV